MRFDEVTWVQDLPRNAINDAHHTITPQPRAPKRHLRKRVRRDTGVTN
jgi:hypothetical protein